VIFALRAGYTLAVVYEPPAPTAAFTVSQNPTIGVPVTFDGSASICSAPPCTYAWNDDGGEPPIGNWPLGTGQMIHFTFKGGAFTAYVRLTVTDASNHTATVEHNVYIAAPSASPPSNTTLPQVSGTTTQGQTLSVSDGSWTGSPTSFAYQWQDCDSLGNNCANIGGASSSSYTLASGDVGHTIRAVVTATNAGGSTPATSTQTSIVTASTGGSSLFVATTGNDANPCTQSAPCLSFDRAYHLAAPGTTVQVASGVYNSQFQDAAAQTINGEQITWTRPRRAHRPTWSSSLRPEP
jgi:hypothetical protein